MTITKAQIKEIAEDLSMGMKVFINKESLEIKTIFDGDEFDRDELWDTELDEIDNWPNVCVISKMKSWEAFKILEGFAHHVDEKFGNQLLNILNRKKPFAHFKNTVETSEYRDQWFAFRQEQYEDYVRGCLQADEISFELGA